MRGYLSYIMKALSFPDDAQESLLRDYDVITACDGGFIPSAVADFESSNYSCALRERVVEMSDAAGVSKYTSEMLCLLLACKRLEGRYEKAGLDRSLFIDTMADLRYKVIECKTVKGVWGTFVGFWFPGFYQMSRFALGRFQYETARFYGDRYEEDGFVLTRGMPTLNLHIPSSGIRLTDEVRFDSYRRAKEFFYPNVKGPVALVCDSWLLYPGYEEFLTDGMNLKRFRSDFSIISVSNSETFGNAWRVFGDKAELSPEKLPRETSQQRMFADYMARGLSHGSAYGVRIER